MNVRYYTNSDYDGVAALYRDSRTFGGQYDDARDTRERLEALSNVKEDCILVAVEGSEVIGTVTIFEDGRSAWLYRFAVQPQNEAEASKLLYEKAVSTLRARGHTQVLVYAPTGNPNFEKRYREIGFTKGNDYTAYWQDI